MACMGPLPFGDVPGEGTSGITKEEAEKSVMGGPVVCNNPPLAMPLKVKAKPPPLFQEEPL